MTELTALFVGGTSFKECKMHKCHFSNISNQISDSQVLLLAVKGTDSLKMHVTVIGSMTKIKAVLHKLCADAMNRQPQY